MVHGPIRRFIAWLFERPATYAHMDFTDPEDFNAACRAVRDRHYPKD